MAAYFDRWARIAHNSATITHVTLKRLSEQQYFELQDQFDRTPGLHDGTLASGEHYLLVALLNRFGYRPRSRQEAIELAQELLANGYDPA